MDFQPLHDRVLVRPDNQAMMIGSIYIPEQAKAPAQEGVVVAVGAGEVLSDGSRRPLDVNVGDRVAVGKYTYDLEVEGEKFYILREAEILGVFS